MTTTTTTVRFVQYMRPHGRQVPKDITLPDPDGRIRGAVAVIIERGLVFECDVLRDEVTCNFTVTHEDAGDIYGAMCANGPEVPPTVTRLITKAAAGIASGDAERRIQEALG